MVGTPWARLKRRILAAVESLTPACLRARSVPVGASVWRMGRFRNLVVGRTDAGGQALVLECRLLGRRRLELQGELAAAWSTLEGQRVVEFTRPELGRAVNVGGKQLVGWDPRWALGGAGGRDSKAPWAFPRSG